MRCPKCRFVSSDKKDVCPNCRIDLRPYKHFLGLPISFPKTSFTELLRQLSDGQLDGKDSGTQIKPPSSARVEHPTQTKSPSASSVHPSQSSRSAASTESSRTAENADLISRMTQSSSLDNAQLRKVSQPAKPSTPPVGHDSLLHNTLEPSMGGEEEDAPLHVIGDFSTPTKLEDAHETYDSDDASPLLTAQEAASLDYEKIEPVSLKKLASQNVAERNEIQKLAEKLQVTPQVRPTVVEFNDDVDELLKELDAMIGDAELDISSVKVDKPVEKRVDPNAAVLIEDDLEISFEFEVEGLEGSEDDAEEDGAEGSVENQTDELEDEHELVASTQLTEASGDTLEAIKKRDAEDAIASDHRVETIEASSESPGEISEEPIQDEIPLDDHPPEQSEPVIEQAREARNDAAPLSNLPSTDDYDKVAEAFNAVFEAYAAEIEENAQEPTPLDPKLFAEDYDPDESTLDDTELDNLDTGELEAASDETEAEDAFDLESILEELNLNSDIEAEYPSDHLPEPSDQGSELSLTNANSQHFTGAELSDHEFLAVVEDSAAEIDLDITEGEIESELPEVILEPATTTDHLDAFQDQVTPVVESINRHLTALVEHTYPLSPINIEGVTADVVEQVEEDEEPVDLEPHFEPEQTTETQVEVENLPDTSPDQAPLIGSPELTETEDGDIDFEEFEVEAPIEPEVDFEADSKFNQPVERLAVDQSIEDTETNGATPFAEAAVAEQESLEEVQAPDDQEQIESMWADAYRELSRVVSQDFEFEFGIGELVGVPRNDVHDVLFATALDELLEAKNGVAAGRKRRRAASTATLPSSATRKVDALDLQQAVIGISKEFDRQEAFEKSPVAQARAQVTEVNLELFAADRFRRFAACVIDLIFTLLVAYAIGYFTFLPQNITGPLLFFVLPELTTALPVLSPFLATCLFTYITLNGLLLSARGMTIGHKSMGIEAVDEQGMTPTFSNSFLWSTLQILHPLSAGLGVIGACFGDRITLADRLAAIRIVAGHLEGSESRPTAR